MKFRPFLGYLIMVASMTLLIATMCGFFLQIHLLYLYGIGVLVGFIVGSVMGQRAWVTIQSLLVNRTDIKGEAGYDLLGPRPSRWVLYILIFYSILIAFPVSVEDFPNIWLFNTLAYGCLSGLTFSYFLILTFLTFWKERELKKRLTIMIGNLVLPNN